ncbi:MAG: translocation/assembly module TamB domain-containing protein, partial [Magnetococcales bacterium]|nr:translocation/assembly module TamB domain-containing protein [Magnetococcales bacterium]
LPLLWRGVASLVLLLIVLLLSALLALQSKTGQQQLAAALEQWLSTPERRLTVEGLHGQLPWELRINRLAWADGAGTWLEVGQLHLEWSLADLWQGRLRVQTVGAERLQLHRQPQPHTPSPSAPTAPPLPGRSWMLLPPLLVERLYINQLILDKAAYGQEARFSLSGGIQHIADPEGNPAAPNQRPNQLLAQLLLRPLDAGETQLTLQARLAPTEPVSGDSQLTVQVEGHEKSGLLAAVTGLSAAKGMTLRLSGQAPIAAWQGQLAVQIDGVGELTGQLALRHGQEPALGFTGRIEGERGWLGPQWTTLFAPAGSPPGARAALTLAVQAEWLQSRRLRLSQLSIASPFAQWAGEGMWEPANRQLQGQVRLNIPQLAPLSPLLGQPLQGSLTTTLVAQGDWQHPHLQLESQVNALRWAEWQVTRLESHWESGAEGQQRDQLRGQGRLLGLHPVGNATTPPAAPWSWSAELQRPATGPLQLTRLELTDQNATAQIVGKLALDAGGGEGQWQLTVARMAEWLTPWLPEPLPWDGRGHWSGLFALQPPGDPSPTATPDPHAASPRLTAHLQGGWSELSGLPPLLQTVLGDTLHTSAQITLRDGGALEITDLQLRGQEMQWQGNLYGDLPRQRVKGQLHMELPQMALLSKWAGIPMRGHLQGDVQLEGPLATPHLQVALHAPELGMGTRQWKHPSAQLVIDGLDSTPHGSLTLDLPMEGQKPSPGDSARKARCDYRLEGTKLRLAALHLPWPGGEMTGETLQIDLAQGLVTGELQGKSSQPGQWLHWLTQESTPFPANLGGMLTMQARWSGQGGEQKLESTLNVQMLRSAEFAKTGFSLLDKATLKAQVADLWGKAHGTIEGELSKLRWGNTQLHTAQWRITGNRRAAEVTLGGKGLLAMGEPRVIAPQAKVARPAPDGFDGQAHGQVGLDDKGVLRITVAGLTGHLGADALQLEEAAHIILTPVGTQHHLDLDRLRIRYGVAHLDGHIHYSAQRLDIEGSTRLPLAMLARLGGPDLRGSAQAELKLSGAPNQPDGLLTLQMQQVHGNDPALKAIPPATVHLQARLEKGQVNTQVAIRDLTSTPITALLLFPVQMGFAPLRLAIPAHGALGGTLNADAQLMQFALLASPGLPGLLDMQKLDGALNIALHFGGTVAAPEVNGKVLVRNGSYENGTLGMVLKGIHLDATAHGRTLVIDTLEATDGGKGHLRATGQLTLDAARHWPFKLESTLEKGALIRRDELHATLSGTLLVEGNGEQVMVRGDLTSNEGQIYLIETNSTDIKALPVDVEIRNGLNLLVADAAHSTAPTPVRLEVALHVPNRFFLRGRGLESEWQGDLTLRGLLQEPLVEGQMLVRRGYFEFLDQKFELRKGIIAFDGTSPPQPNLDLEAESKNTGNMVAVLSLQGPAFTPTLKLGSEPELAQDEILARLLFNRNRQQLTPAQALSLAVAVDKLRSGGPGLLGKARENLGIDRLELGGESVEAGSVKAGKYISDTVFVGVERGLKQGSGKVSVELELTPNVTIQTEMDEGNQSGVGVNWKYDY